MLALCYTVCMNNAKKFRLLCIFFIAGISFGSFLRLPLEIEFGVALYLIISFSIFYRNRKATAVAFFVAMFALGVWYVNQEIESFENLKLKKISVTAIVHGVREKYSTKEIIVTVPEFSKKILVVSSSFSEIHEGNIIELQCSLEIPKIQNEDFDYRMYLARDGIGYVCKKPYFKIISERKNVFGVLKSFREKGERVLDKLIPQPEAGLAKGVLFGGNNLLSQSVADAFSKTGTTHIVAVSGYNVTIIVEYLILLGVFMGLWRRQAVVFAIVGIVSFVVMVGFSASAVRAAVMASVLLWAMRYGRLSKSSNAILFAATCMLLLNPLLLRWDIGFQLSFLATIGIVFVSPLLDPWREKIKLFGIMDAVIVTLCAQILVVPIIAYNFKTFSVISVLANMLVLPLIPIAMMFAFAAVTMGLINFFLGLPFAWITYLILHLVVKIIQFLASFSWASISFETTPGVVILWYIFVFGIIGLLARKKKYEI